MTTLNINGKKVKVSDDFLKLSPEQQNATVDEIARSMGMGAQPAPDTPRGPDGMTTAERIAAVKAGTLAQPSPERLAEVGTANTEAETAMRDKGALHSIVQGGTQGLTFGFGDEAVAGLVSALPGWTYDQALAAARGELSDARLARPKTTMAAEVAGSVAPALAGAGAVGIPGSLGGRALAGAGAGAASGALYGFGTGEGGFAPRMASAAAGGLGGAALGAAIPIAGSYAREGIEALMNNRTINRAIAAAPSLSDLKSAASAIYNQADNVTNLPRADFAAKATGMLDDAARSGMDDMLTPGAARVAGKIDDAAQVADPNIGFRELDILRKQAGIPAGNVANRTEASIGSRMIEGIDDFIDTVDPSLSGAIKEARATWAQLRRSELVDKAIDRARNAASGFENGLRVEFRRILNNPKLLRGFNEAEIDALKRVARGTASGNLMRQVGRIGIGLSGQSNGLGATIGGIAGTALGGPLAGAATVGIGTGMKALAERSTRKAAEKALSTISARAALQGLPQASYPMIERALTAGGLTGVPHVAGQLGNMILGR